MEQAQRYPLTCVTVAVDRVSRELWLFGEREQAPVRERVRLDVAALGVSLPHWLGGELSSCSPASDHA